MTTFEYATNPKTSTIHVVNPRNRNRTLCGIRDAQWWAIGDETTSGIAATCGHCRRLVRRQTAKATA